MEGALVIKRSEVFELFFCFWQYTYPPLALCRISTVLIIIVGVPCNLGTYLSHNTHLIGTPTLTKTNELGKASNSLWFPPCPLFRKLCCLSVNICFWIWIIQRLPWGQNFCFYSEFLSFWVSMVEFGKNSESFFVL